MNEQDWRLLEADRSVEELRIDGWLLQRGARVRLHPRARGDVFDLTLEGRTAQVESIEQDLEGNFMVAVVLDEDPGAYLGLLRMPGHRFFFSPQELERLPPTPDTPLRPLPSTRTILVAGIGNVFLGDDGFGVEVAHRLAGRSLPGGVTVTDFGIRGYDLAYALVRGADYTILVDACPRGEPPGTVFVLEPDLTDLDARDGGPAVVDAHDLNPLHVLRLARSLGAELRKVVVVGCEPATLGPPEGHMGLSDPVRAAVDEAVPLIEGLIARFSAATA
ncbi:MAG TPA: hydrogenase maturation protease [Gemmatimonadales bacterium]